MLGDNAFAFARADSLADLTRSDFVAPSRLIESLAVLASVLSDAVFRPKRVLVASRYSALFDACNIDSPCDPFACFGVRPSLPSPDAVPPTLAFASRS